MPRLRWVARRGRPGFLSAARPARVTGAAGAGPLVAFGPIVARIL